MNIMLYEQLRDLYTNYVMIKPIHKPKDYICKAGGLNVTITTGEGNHRKTATGN